ncbi:Uncharacterised protein [Burkholderia pseudomallei]|nr:Uncharacterised protein [Burkholderia pseudomallei]
MPAAKPSPRGASSAAPRFSATARHRLLRVVEDQRDVRVAVARLRVMQQPRRLARRVHRAVGDHVHARARGERLVDEPARALGQIEQHVMELMPERADEPRDRARAPRRLAVVRQLGRQHEEPVALRDHRLMDQLRVEPLRILQQLDEPLVADDAEHRARRAAVAVEIDVRDAAARAVREMARERDRDARHADAAARADEADRLARARGGVRIGRRQRAMHELDGQRLDEIIAHADAQHAAKQPDVVALADHDHVHRWIADVGEPREIGQRHRRARHVDEQMLRPVRKIAHQRDRVVDSAARDLRARHRLIGDQVADHLVARRVGDDRDEARAARRVAQFLHGPRAAHPVECAHFASASA